MLEAPEEMDKERYCFPAAAKLRGAACCEAQRLFRNEITRLQSDPATRSQSATYDRIFLPLKVFFILIVVVIAALLAKWRDRLDQYYHELVPPIERGVIIGAFAMLFWPIMDYGYQQTANVLFGRFHGAQLRYSLVIVPWALLLLFYFLRRLGRQGEMIGQIAGVVTAAVAVLRYEDLNDWAVRMLGIGTTQVDRRGADCSRRHRIHWPDQAIPRRAGASRLGVRIELIGGKANTSERAPPGVAGG